VALIDSPDEARELARAICADIASYARSFVAAGTDISPQVQEGRALYLSRVAPGLGMVFDEALLEHAAEIDLRTLSGSALGTLNASSLGLSLLDDEESRRIRAELQRTPRSEAVGVESGALVRVTGRVVGRTPRLTTPIGGKPCVLYVLEAGEGLRDPEPESRQPPWSRFPLEMRASDFVVDDGTATVVVQPRGARASLQFRDGDWRLEPAVAHRDFLVSRGRRSPLLDEAPRRRQRFIHFRETTLAEGDRVTIMGVASREPDPSPEAVLIPYRASPQRYVFRAAERSPLFIFQEARR
jgi:hypothetical protein